MFVDDYGRPASTSKHYHLGDRVVFFGSCITGCGLVILWLSGALG